jgi:quinolinate synthase
MLFQPPLPPKYSALTEEEMGQAILERKRVLGSRLVILGHHYQQNEVIRFADFTGDSLKLSQIGAQQKDAEFIVFCGVHFMAESADILTDDRVKVILPDLSAGCSMADMADIEQVEEAWDFLTDACPEPSPELRRARRDCGVHALSREGTVIPITYVNSAAAIKAFCGEHGGACCTSSNARRVLEWAFTQGDKVMFLPDQHLGRNTAYSMGIPLDQMVVYDPKAPRAARFSPRGLSNACSDDGRLMPDHVRDAKVILWKGHCSVHGLFTEGQCDEIRRLDPECKILVHPECKWEVVQKADLAGSTEFIIRTVREAPPGSKWAIGTEIHLISRLVHEHPEQSIRSLAGIQCLCTTMYRIDMRHLLWTLDELVAGRVVNQIQVDPQTKRLALVALQRMLANVNPQPVAVK